MRKIYLIFCAAAMVGCAREMEPEQQVPDYSFSAETSVTNGVSSKTAVVTSPTLTFCVTEGEDVDYNLYYTIDQGSDYTMRQNVWVGMKETVSLPLSVNSSLGEHEVSGYFERDDGQGDPLPFKIPFRVTGKRAEGIEVLGAVSSVFADIGYDGWEIEPVSPKELRLSAIDTGSVRIRVYPLDANVALSWIDGDLRMDLQGAVDEGDGVFRIPYGVSGPKCGKTRLAADSGNGVDTLSFNVSYYPTVEWRLRCEETAGKDSLAFYCDFGENTTLDRVSYKPSLSMKVQNIYSGAISYYSNIINGDLVEGCDITGSRSVRMFALEKAMSLPAVSVKVLFPSSGLDQGCSPAFWFFEGGNADEVALADGNTVEINWTSDDYLVCMDPEVDLMSAVILGFDLNEYLAELGIL